MKITSVNVRPPPEGAPPGNGDGPAKIAIFFQGIYSLFGLIAGVVFLAGGLLLLLSGIGGSSHFVAGILGAKLDITDATAGVIVAALGFFVIVVTRFEVRFQNRK